MPLETIQHWPIRFAILKDYVIGLREYDTTETAHAVQILFSIRFVMHAVSWSKQEFSHEHDDTQRLRSSN